MCDWLTLICGFSIQVGPLTEDTRHIIRRRRQRSVLVHVTHRADENLATIHHQMTLLTWLIKGLPTDHNCYFHSCGF